MVGLRAQEPVGWGYPYLSADTVAEIDAKPLTWSCNDPAALPLTIYGYFLYDEYQNLLWAELLVGGPVVLTVVGQQIELVLSLTLRNDTLTEANLTVGGG